MKSLLKSRAIGHARSLALVSVFSLLLSGCAVQLRNNATLSDGTASTGQTDESSSSQQGTTTPPTITVISDLTGTTGLSFGVSFSITGGSALSCSADYLSLVSDDGALIQDSSVVFSGTNSVCTATITPEDGPEGIANLNIIVRDGSYEASADFAATLFFPDGFTIFPQQLGSHAFNALGMYDKATAQTSDGNGNIFVVGWTPGSLGEMAGGLNDVFLVKFNSSGTLQWVRQLGYTTLGTASSGNDIATGVALDGSGNIFITGTTSGSLAETNGGGTDTFIAKYSSAGVFQWVRQMGNTTIGGTADDGSDDVKGIGVDGFGDIYVAGSTSGSLGETNGGSTDAFIAKYSAAGAFQWVKQMGNTTIGGTADNGTDTITSIAVDSAGNSYMAGYTSGSLGEATGGSNDIIIAKYNVSGAFQWVKQMGNTTIGGAADNGDDQALAITLNGSGDLLFTGRTNGSMAEATAGNNDVIVGKYSSAGTFQWVKQMGGVTLTAGALGAGGGDIGQGIAIDGSGDIFVSGLTYSNVLGENNGGSSDAFIAKYTAGGAYQWVRQLGDTTLGAAADGAEDFSGISLDTSGNIYISGWTTGDFGETNAGGTYDIAIAKYNSAGVYQWAKQLGNITMPGGTAELADLINATVMDEDGNLYVTGYTAGSLAETNGGSNDTFVAKYNSAGTQQWVRQLGNTTIGGTADDGNDLPKAIAVNADGDVFVAGQTNGSLGETSAAGSNDVFLAKYNAAGVFQWVKQMGNTTIGASANGTETVFSMAIRQSTGDVFITGHTTGSLGESVGGGMDVFLAKYDSTGAFQWVKQMGNTTIGGTADDGNDKPAAMTIDPSGNLFIAGSTTGSLAETNGGGNDFFLVKYSAAGVLQWVRQMGNTTIGGTADDGNDQAQAITIDGSGNLFIAGTTYGSLGEAHDAGTHMDVVLAKYNAAGVFQWVKQMGNVTVGGTADDGNDVPMGITIDSQGDLFMAGYTSGSLGETAGGNDDVFLVKYSAAGVFQWTKQLGAITLGASAAGSDLATSIAIDANDNIYGGGYSNGRFSGTNTGANDGLVFRWSP